jgi:hypothetical protein
MSCSLVEHDQTKIPRAYLIYKAIKKLIDQENIDLNNPVWEVKKYKWAGQLDCSIDDINNCLIKIRGQYGKHPLKSDYRGIRITRPIRTKLNYDCLNNNMIRMMPRQENIVCTTIELALMDMLPRGGRALLIGTPTPFSACPINGKYELTCDDNLAVARMLRNTTEVPGIIVIGNGIDKEKALLKAQEFKSLGSTYNFEIILDVVDSDTFRYYVEFLARTQEAENKPAKVVLLNSGVFKNSDSTYRRYQEKFPGLNLNLDFETPSIVLTKQYKNLHILAMARGIESNPNIFSLLYIHHGIIDIVKLSNINDFDITTYADYSDQLLI